MLLRAPMAIRSPRQFGVVAALAFWLASFVVNSTVTHPSLVQIWDEGGVFRSRIVLSSIIRAEWPYGSSLEFSHREFFGSLCGRHTPASGLVTAKVLAVPRLLGDRGYPEGRRSVLGPDLQSCFLLRLFFISPSGLYRLRPKPQVE